jgi:hypothetical protein
VSARVQVRSPASRFEDVVSMLVARAPRWDAAAPTTGLTGILGSSPPEEAS